MSSGEGFLPWIKRKIRYRLEHLRYRDITVNGETARWYPDHAGGSLQHEDWWALVKPHELEDLEERFASDEPGVHICKIPVYSAKWFRENKPLLDMKYNPLAHDEDISIPCGICRSYSCCRPGIHFAAQSRSEPAPDEDEDDEPLTWAEQKGIRRELRRFQLWHALRRKVPKAWESGG